MIISVIGYIWAQKGQSGTDTFKNFRFLTLFMKIIKHYKNRSIKDIAETLGISSSAATQFVDGLVRSGYMTWQYPHILLGGG